MRFRPPVERLSLRRIPLAAVALCFAVGILAEQKLHAPTLLLLTAFGACIVLTGVSLRLAVRVAWVPVAAAWLVLGVAAARWQPSVPIPVALLGFADNLSRTVDAKVMRVRVLPAQSGTEAATDSDAVPPWERSEQVADVQAGERAVSVDLAVQRVEYLTPDLSRMVPVSGGVRVTIYGPLKDVADLDCGDDVELPLRLKRPDTYRDPGAFDYAAYLLEHDGIAARASVSGEEVRVIGRSAANWRCLLSGAQSWAVARLARLKDSRANRVLPAGLRLDQNDSAMLAAMLFGDRTGLSQQLKQGFERTGTFHLFVVSGLHVALLAAGLFWIFRRMRLHAWLATLLTLAGAAGYAALTGFGQPTQRALAMTAMYLLARLLSRDTNPLNALGAAVLGMLVWSPSSLFGASLQMTVLVIVAIAGLAIPLNRWLFANFASGAKDAWRFPRRSYDPAASGVRVALELWGEALAEVLGRWALRLPAWVASLVVGVCELAVLGVVTELVLALTVAIYFHRAAVFAVPANMLVLPLVGVLASLAVATFAVSLLSPWLAMVPGAATGGLLHTLTWAIARLGHAHRADLRVPGPSLWIAAFAVLAWLACCWLVRRSRRGAWVTAAVLPLMALVVLWPERIVRTPGVLEITAIDVGQGDSLLAIAPDGQTMLIDGGGPIGSHGASEIVSNFDVGEQVVSPYVWTRRIRRLDVVVLTHAHTDHMGGLPAVLRNFRPRELWVGIDPNSKLYRSLLAEAAGLGVTVRHLHAGDQRQWGAVQVTVLAPAVGYANVNAPKNDDSLVMTMQMGKASVLLEGDAERPSEDAMLAGGRVTPVTLLKVGHHGSRTSSNPEFLAAAAPREAVISVGRNNPFGHPYGAVIDRFAAARTPLFRTDEFGLTSFLLRADGSVQVSAYGMPLPSATLPTAKLPATILPSHALPANALSANALPAQ